MENPPSYEAAMAGSSRRISAPAIISQTSSTPPIISDVSTTPPVISGVPETLPELSEEPTTPPVPSEVPATSPITVKVPWPRPVVPQFSMTPSVLFDESPTPPLVYKEPSAPPEQSQVAPTSPLVYKEPSAPPEQSQVASTPPLPPAMQMNFGSLTDDTIRRICYNFAEKNFKNGTGPIEHLTFSNIKSCYSLHYKLETFWESREFAIKNEKCTEGKPIDGPNNGPEPNIGSIFVVCRKKFQNATTYVAVPHSEHLRNCRKCDDRGKEVCLVCKGTGWNHCNCCNGAGYLKDRSACMACNKTGRLICDPCYSSGRINCAVCDGFKKVKSYKELKVTWTNHVDDFDLNPTDIPIDLLKSSTSNEILSDECPRVQPLTLFPDARINIASLNLNFKHQKDCANKNVLLQRQSVRAVPITKISYYCKGKTGKFYVHGTENSVYFENYTDLLLL